MAWTFEWDEAKDLLNRQKHGIGFDEAKTVFNDPRSLTIHDAEHSDEEDRFIDVGISARDRVLVVSYMDRESNIRIISCRKATKFERKTHEQNAQEN